MKIRKGDFVRVRDTYPALMAGVYRYLGKEPLSQLVILESELGNHLADSRVMASIEKTVRLNQKQSSKQSRNLRAFYSRLYYWVESEEISELGSYIPSSYYPPGCWLAP